MAKISQPVSGQARFQIQCFKTSALNLYTLWLLEDYVFLISAFLAPSMKLGSSEFWVMSSDLGMTLKAESPCSFHHVDVDHEVWMLEADKVLHPSTGWPCHCPYYPTWPSLSHWSSSSWDYQWNRGDNSTAIIPLPSILFPPLTLVHLFQSLCF